MKLANEIKVALVTAGCVLALAIVFKNILYVRADLIVTNGPFYLFIVYLITRGQTKASKCDKPLYWSLAIVLVTIAIVVLYAL